MLDLDNVVVSMEGHPTRFMVGIELMHYLEHDPSIPFAVQAYYAKYGTSIICRSLLNNPTTHYLVLAYLMNRCCDAGVRLQAGGLYIEKRPQTNNNRYVVFDSSKVIKPIPSRDWKS